MQVYEGEDPVASKNIPLDTFKIGCDPLPEEQDVKVRMQLGNDGILHVTAEVAGETKGVTVDRTGPQWGQIVECQAFKEDEDSFKAAGDKRKRCNE